MPALEAEADGAKQQPRGTDNGGTKASAAKAAKTVTAGSLGSAPDQRSNAEQVDSSSDDDSDSDQNEQDEDDHKDQPLQKKAKAEVVHGLSGDEVSTRAALNNCVMQVMLHPYHVSSAVACALGQVDTSNIIEGGRRTRRGGVSSAVQTAGAKPPEVADLSDDEW